MKEAIIYVNGKELTIQEAMTLRVAITSYLMQMNSEGLEDDEHGKTISDLYSKNCESIIKKIMISCN